MVRTRTRRVAAALLLVLVLPACGGEAGDGTAAPAATLSPSGTPVEDPVGFAEGATPADELDPTASEPTSPEATTSPAAPSPAPTTTTPSPTPATVDDTHPVVLTWDGIDLRTPTAATELIGLHQSNHDGARDMEQVDSPVRTIVLDSRERGTGRRTAADIVAHRDTEVRAPVTGTVVRAGTYTLYCDQQDDFAVIEPDGRPGIEVKLLHIDGVQVRAGDRVEAGVTVLAPALTQLPFASQVDEQSGPDNWPHVHLELVDTSIPDQPNPNSGSDDC